MAPFCSKAQKLIWLIISGFSFYVVILLLLVHSPWLQKHVFYAHKFDLAQFYGLNKPEQWGFAKNQVTPFNITTPDDQILYAWHVLPLGLYAKHEADLVKEHSGCTKDITISKGLQLLRDDAKAKLIINFHGNAGSIAQGWRPDIYRSLSDGSTSDIHILAVDYRGYGYSSGSPSEKGLLLDGITTVKWALEIAGVPAERIVLIGHSLGTAVTSAVAEHFALNGIEFAGIVLIAAFTDVPNLLSTYAIAGWVPILSPLRVYPLLQTWFRGKVVDTWSSITRLETFVRISKRLRLFLIHAVDDYEISYLHSHALFLAAANATTEGMDTKLLEKMKARDRIEFEDGGSMTTWKASGDKIIKQQIVAQGGHNRIMTYAPVALAALQAFGKDYDTF